MPVIFKCQSCDEETVVEQVLPGGTLTCIHCGFERPTGINGTSLWSMDEPLTDMANDGNES